MRRLALATFSLAALAITIWSASAQNPQPKKDVLRIEPLDLKLLAKEPVPPQAGDSELLKLQKERYATAWKELKLQLRYLEAGSWDVGALFQYADCFERVGVSCLAMNPSKEAKIEFLTNSFEVARSVEAILKLRFDVGSIREQDYLKAKYLRLNAEIKLLEAKDAK